MTKLAIVTGGTRGIGRATSFELAKRGYRVIATYLNNSDSAASLRNQIHGIGGDCIIVQADAADPSSFVDIAKIAQKIGDPPSILVNNAGRIARPGNWDTQSDADILATINLNLSATIFSIRAFAPLMKAVGAGSIINLTSTYAFTGAAAVLAYTAAKQGIVSVTRSMARELGPHGVTVNAVAPGNIDTEMTQSAGQGVVEWAISTTPVGRLGRPDEVASAILFLAESPFITGHTLVVDGGQLLNM